MSCGRLPSGKPHAQGTHVGVVLGLAGLLACATACRESPEPPELDEGAQPAAVHAEPPPLNPGATSQVNSLVLAGDVLIIGTEAGLLRAPLASRRHRLLDADEGFSHAAVVALAADEEGRVYSAHHSEASTPDLRGGGVRSFSAGGEFLRAWFEEDGLGPGEVTALAVDERRLVVAVGDHIATLARGDESQGFELAFTEATRRLSVVRLGEEEPEGPTVSEFRPRGEATLALALDGDALWIGTTHGLYLQAGPEDLRRFEVPCRVNYRVPTRVAALAADAGGVTAVLTVPLEDGEHAPGGLLEIDSDGSFHCHVPGVDVPDAVTLAVARDEGRTWLATHEGPTLLFKGGAELFGVLSGAPRYAVTALAPTEGGCWMGTWGGGVYHLKDRAGVLLQPSDSGSGRFEERRFQLR